MQQSGKKWIIIVSILLAAVLFVLFIPYGKDAAVCNPVQQRDKERRSRRADAGRRQCLRFEGD